MEWTGVERIGMEGIGKDWPFFKHPDAYLAMNFEHIGQARRGMERTGMEWSGSF